MKNPNDLTKDRVEKYIRILLKVASSEFDLGDFNLMNLALTAYKKFLTQEEREIKAQVEELAKDHGINV